MKKAKIKTEEEIYTDLTNLNYYTLKMSMSKELARKHLNDYKKDLDKIKHPSDKLVSKYKEAEENIKFWLEKIGDIILKTREDLKKSGCEFLTIRTRNQAINIYNLVTGKEVNIKIDKVNIDKLEETIIFEVINILE